MQWVALTLGVCLVSALLPVINAELYLIALATQQPQLRWWLLGLTAAVGQLIGKLVYFYLGRGSVRLPTRWHRLHRSADPQRHRRWSGRLTRFRQTCRNRPVWAATVLLTAAVVGLPPLAATSFAAGVAGISVRLFVLTGLIGRFARFSAIVASPGLLQHWWF